MHKKTIKFMCINCGKDVEFFLSRQSVHKFCSQKCRNEFLGSKKTILVICEVCGTIKYLWDNPNQSFKFCSRECYLKYKARETIYLTCKVCGKTKVVNKSEIDRGHYKEYCSQACRTIAIGKLYPKKYRLCGIWKNIRKDALKRDKFKCQLCGKKAKIVHHIIPYKDFPTDESANKLENLISLCRECHELTFSHEYDYVGTFFKVLKGESKDG